MTANEIEIRRIVAAQVEGWNRGDADAWGADSEPGMGFTNILGMRWTTQAAMITRHAEMFRGPFAGSRVVMEIERLEFPAPTVAVVELRTRLTNYRALPPGIRGMPDGTLVTRMLEVLTLRDGRWRISACHNTAVAPGVG
ncbi:MAG: SgcJ/EcaC family oxidoreductase [Gemmatimonadaceae bacterium]